MVLTHTFFSKLVRNFLVKSQSQITPKFSMTASYKRSTEDELKYFGQTICKCFIYMEQFSGKCYPIVSCLDRPRPIKLRRFQMVNEKVPNNTAQNQPKYSSRPAAFRQILQFDCGFMCVCI